MSMFKEGIYQHETGFRVNILADGTIYVSTDAPAFINLQDFFNPAKWTKIS